MITDNLDYITTVFDCGETSNFSSWEYYYLGFVGINNQFKLSTIFMYWV